MVSVGHRSSCVVALLVLAGAALTACGGGSDPEPTPTVKVENTPTVAPTETVAGATTVAPTATIPAETTYTVVAGDTLGAIAAEFGVTVAAIVDANGIVDPNQIEVGQVLVIPN